MIMRQLRKCVKVFASSNNSGPRRGCVALGQEFVEERNEARKKAVGSNFLMPINDRASKEARDRAIDPRVPGMPVEKLGRNSASRNREGIGRKKSARIPARQNSHVIPRVEFDDGMAVSMPSRRPSWNCYIRDWQLSTGTTNVRSTDGSSLILGATRVRPINWRVCQSRLYVRNYRSARYISYNTRIIMHAKCASAT
ncbi:unnamed protein product [Lasius platythorax]|uniref:Uncharacterized protein n=1 Tax=Lasius platythorax TaxID=488582 RepID=A0AAV2P944_9HYME